VIVAEILRGGAALFVAVLLQTSIVGSIEIAGGTPDILLVTLVAVALLRGSVYGAAAGFFAGLVLDVALLGRLGESSLLLTTAGYWIGRYGETTGRDRSHAPLLSVAVITVLYALASVVLHVVLGDPADARVALFEALLPSILLNLLLTVPVYALAKRVLGPPEWSTAEVRLLG
jgi:rod shape-determining protein MreD